MGQAIIKKAVNKAEKIEKLNKIMADGCTASPDFNFTDCCNVHDEDYGAAKITRWQADKKLRQCISKKGVGFYKFKVLPWVYWGSVRVFGGKHYGNECRTKCKICDYFSKKALNLKNFFL